MGYAEGGGRKQAGEKGKGYNDGGGEEDIEDGKGKEWNMDRVKYDK